MRKQVRKRSLRFTPSSGNVFADLGLPDAEELNTKVRLGIAISHAIKETQVTQIKAAELLGLSQPKISALLNLKLDGFSVERLMHLLTLLNYDVIIDVRPKSTAGTVHRVPTGQQMNRLQAPGEQNSPDQMGESDEFRKHLPHTLEAYACAFGLDRMASPMDLPRLT